MLPAALSCAAHSSAGNQGHPSQCPCPLTGVVSKDSSRATATLFLACEMPLFPLATCEMLLLSLVLVIGVVVLRLGVFSPCRSGGGILELVAEFTVVLSLDKAWCLFLQRLPFRLHPPCLLGVERPVCLAS